MYLFPFVAFVGMFTNFLSYELFLYKRVFLLFSPLQLEKDAEQQRLLDASAKEMDARHKRETELKKKLEEQEV